MANGPVLRVNTEMCNPNVAKVRQAQMLVDLNKHDAAHELLKQALASEPNNLNLRAYYTYFLIQSNLPKPAKEFVWATLKDHDRHDLYSLCAAAWIHYHQARESRDPSPKGIDERKKGFQRAADFYQKALSKDATLAFAAQGLAIIIAEDALGNLGGAIGPIGHDEGMKRLQNAREALDVFAKVRESLNDGSVYVNMGHCYYARDEFDRAIESVRVPPRGRCCGCANISSDSTRQRQDVTTTIRMSPSYCASVGHTTLKPPGTSHSLL